MEGLSGAQLDVLAEAMTRDSDPAAIVAENQAAGKAFAAAGSGDFITIVGLDAPGGNPFPGDRLSVAVTLRNSAKDGSTAVFDLGLCDYHDGNKDIALTRSQRLAAGAVGTWKLSFTIPRDGQFGAYVYVSPVNFTGSVLPQKVLNYRVTWDETTMTEAEILDLLRERNPCPKEYPLEGERAAAWLSRFRAEGSLAARIELEKAAYEEQRRQLEAEYLARISDPEYRRKLAADAEAEANTLRLAAYEAQQKWAREWGDREKIDLSGILDDHIFIDDKAKLHGDLDEARRSMLAAIAEKENRNSAVERYFMDYGDESRKGRVYRRQTETIAPTLAVIGALSTDDWLVKGMKATFLDGIEADYASIRKAYADAGTSLTAFTRDLEALRNKVDFAEKRLANSVSSAGAEAVRKLLDSVRGRIGAIDEAMGKASALAARIKASGLNHRLAGYTAAGFSTLGTVWSYYDLAKKMEMRVAAGEAFETAIAKELAPFAAVQALSAKVPVLAAADTIMQATGHVLKRFGPVSLEAAGVDPTQYNASSLIEMGSGIALAGLEDSMSVAGRSLGRGKSLDEEERAILAGRLAFFESRLETATDPGVRKRLMELRETTRQLLGGR
jgi:hypothetical protein